MKSEYHFSVLRYVSDPLTQEFVNIGIVLYAPLHGFIRAICTMHYSRVSKMFGKIDGASFRSLTRYLQSRVDALQEEMARGLLFADDQTSLQTMLAKILPEDDSAVRFVPGGVGFTEDPARTLSHLYERYIGRYESPSDLTRRDDEEVWRVFRGPLEQQKVTPYLAPKKIIAKDFEYEFQRSWKNGIWHVYEPISLDLVDGSQIQDKANRWLGRAISLMDSSEAFKLFLLLGEPKSPGLEQAFQKAQNILARIPIKKQLVREQEAEEFAEGVRNEIEEHQVHQED